MVSVSLKTEESGPSKEFQEFHERVRRLEPLTGISLDSRAGKRKTSKYEKPGRGGWILLSIFASKCFPRLTFFSPRTLLSIERIKLIPFGGAKLERKLDCSKVDKAPRSRTHQT